MPRWITRVAPCSTSTQQVLAAPAEPLDAPAGEAQRGTSGRAARATPARESGPRAPGGRPDGARGSLPGPRSRAARASLHSVLLTKFPGWRKKGVNVPGSHPPALSHAPRGRTPGAGCRGTAPPCRGRLLRPPGARDPQQVGGQPPPLRLDDQPLPRLRVRLRLLLRPLDPRLLRVDQPGRLREPDLRQAERRRAAHPAAAQARPARPDDRHRHGDRSVPAGGEALRRDPFAARGLLRGRGAEPLASPPSRR